jgi:1-phosphofructokinase
MILSLTLNPAIDVALSTDRIVYDDRSFITREIESVGGKGINAAMVINAFGGDVRAITPFGGVRGERFAQLMAESQIPVEMIPVEAETRRNISVTDNQGLTIKLDQPGQGLNGPELEQIVACVGENLPGVAWFMLTGSVPRGVPADTYARLIEMARSHGVPVLVDTSGEPLEKALEAKPALVKPNRVEAERLLGRSLITEGHALEAAVEIERMGAEKVILSLGSQGAIAVWSEGRLRAVPPAVQTGCPIGAGDVLAATCLWALVRGESFDEAFRWGVASATVAASRPGLGYGTPDEVDQVRQRVEIRSI